MGESDDPRLTPEVARVAAEHGLGGLRHVTRPWGRSGGRWNPPDEVRTYEFDGGLVRLTRTGIDVFAWADVEFVTEVRYHRGGGRAGPRATLHRSVRRRDGTGSADGSGGATGSADGSGGATGSADVSGRGERIAHRIALLSSARARERLARGEEVAFGSIVIGAAGLTVHGRRIWWAQVRRVRVLREGVAVYRRYWPLRWAWVPLGEVPDAEVVSQLVDSFLSRRGRAA